MTLAKIIASVLGIGYLGKGSGTVAAALAVAAWYAFSIADLPLAIVGCGLIVLCAIGVVVSNKVEPMWGVDSSKVVIDEFAGMGITLFALPMEWGYVVSAFLVFRVLDIVKPLGIARMERLPKGWGVMGDDVLAGIYGNLVLQVVARSYFQGAP